MTRPKIAGYTLIVTLMAATCMTALCILLKQPTAPQPRILFVGDGAGESWARIEAGARAAAHDFGISVRFESPAPEGDPLDQQTAILRKINYADCDGVAFCPAEPTSQAELINALADDTKLVTVGKDTEESHRLCNVGFCAYSTGRMAAWLARAELPRDGKVVLLYSEAELNTDVSERLEGFKEAWAEVDDKDTFERHSIVSIDVNSANIMSTTDDGRATLIHSQVAIVIAFDTEAAEAAIDSFGAQRQTARIPIIAFDPNSDVLDAIDDGRVDLAIYDDPYRKGYEAIERLALYCHEGAVLPVPGRGSVPLVGEVVRKANLDSFRQRAKLRPLEQRIANHLSVAAPVLE
jgi:ribose transport system substrate-binding protein